jgi:hypothetical protein
MAFPFSLSTFRHPTGRCGYITGERSFENDRSYVEAQLRELITLCEEVTGKKV